MNHRRNETSGADNNNNNNNSNIIIRWKFLTDRFVFFFFSLEEKTRYSLRRNASLIEINEIYSGLKLIGINLNSNK